MTKDIQLFDYQEDMVKRVLETFRYHDSVMVQMPTGTGKTHVLAAIVGLFLKKNVCIVAHRRELVSQIKDTLARFFPDLDSEKIQVTSIQWLSRHYREIKEQPGLIVVDEAHHALAETYAEVMNAYPKAKKLGLKGMPKSEMVSWGELAKRAYLIIPLALLIFLVSSGSRTMQFSAAVAIL